MAFGSKFGLGKKQQQHQDPSLQHLQRIINSYDPKSPDYQFGFIVFNSKPKPKTTGLTTKSNTFGGANKGTTGGGFGKGAKKPYISDELWNSELQKCGDDKELSVIEGFPGLKARREAHTKLLNELYFKIKSFSERLEKIQDGFKDIESAINLRVVDLNQKIHKQLLEIVSPEELKSLQSVPFSPEEQDLYDKLETIQANIKKPNQYQSQMNKFTLISELIE